MSEQSSTRAKTLGKLVQKARLKAGRSADDCAQALGISNQKFAEIEAGEFIIALPDLEVLAMFLDVPMAHFWGNGTSAEADRPDYAAYLLLRQRIIGALLSQARLDHGRSLADIADQTGIEAERLAAYEAGGEPVPYFDLEDLSACLDLPVSHFSLETQGPLARHEAAVAAKKRLAEMPDEVRAFVTEPINLSYLETAIRLSEMDVDKLRAIAEGILDITY